MAEPFPNKKQLFFATGAVVAAAAGAAFIYYCYWNRSSSPASPPADAAAAAAAPISTFDPKKVGQFMPFKLVKKERFDRNGESDPRRTYVFTFELPHLSHQCLGVPALKHVSIRMMLPKLTAAEGAAASAAAASDGEENEAVQRTYTPLTSDFETVAQQQERERKCRIFELLIKVYEGGRLTPQLEKLAVGSSVDMRGPTGMSEYLGGGVFSLRMGRKKIRASKVSMVTGGTGVTPMIQLLKSMLVFGGDSESAVTEVCGLYANSTLDDVLCQEFLEELAAKHKEKFKLQFTVSRKTGGAEGAADKWKYFTGRVDEEMLRSFLPALPVKKVDATSTAAEGVVDDVGSIVVLCGPPGMVKATKENLVKIGYDAEDQIIVM